MRRVTDSTAKFNRFWRRKHTLGILALAATVLVGLGTPAAGADSCAGWKNAWHKSPTPRAGHAAVFDSARGVTVLFGGHSSWHLENDETWEYDGTEWTMRDIPGPSPRTQHAMAYDSGRDVTVLHGGTYGWDTLPGETWEYDGTSWTLRTTDGPSGRYNAAMAYDSQRGVTVLFGGDYDNPETWEWDGNEWTMRTMSGPTGRTSLAMAYDASRGRVVLFAGGDPTYNGETWEYDGYTWYHRSNGGPEARAGHSMVYDSDREVVVLFGGDRPHPDDLDDVWEWNGVYWVEVTPAEGPTPREEQVMVYDNWQESVVMFGGADADLNGQTWELKDGEWSMAMQGTLAARYRHAAVFDSGRGRMVITAENDYALSTLQTWEFDGEQWYIASQEGPSRRWEHAMAYDIDRGRTVLYGGTFDQITWEWDGNSWTSFEVVPAPEISDGSAMVYDKARQETIIFGGLDMVYTPVNELWAWDGSYWTHKYTGGPAPRLDHAMAYDPVRQVTVLFGGQGFSSGTEIFGDTWEWDGSSWTQVAADGPAPRYGHSMAYDASRGVVVLAGGHGDMTEHETWEWDGVSWQMRPRENIPSKQDFVMVYDTSNDRLLLHGGYNGSNVLYRMLEYRIPADCPCDSDQDGDVDLSDFAEFSICMTGPDVPYDPDGPSTVDVSVGPGFTFSPQDVEIQVGDTVHWFWAGGFHNVESGVGGVHDGNFSSGSPTSAGGTTFDVTFDAAFLADHPMPDNLYPYYCVVHEGAGMIGSVSVAPHPCEAFDADEDGDVDLADYATFMESALGSMP